MSTVTASPDPLRAQLHQMWSGVAGAWGAHVAYVDARGQHVTDRLLELAQPRPGERVLELACGTGGPGLDAAPLVAPGGEVVISDFAAEMTAIAAGRIAELGLPNASTRVLDLERIDEPDESYDVVLCREGLMLVPDPSSPRARSAASSDPAAGSRSACGARASATPGSVSCSTRSASSWACRRRSRASPTPSRSPTPASWARC